MVDKILKYFEGDLARQNICDGGIGITEESPGRGGVRFIGE